MKVVSLVECGYDAGADERCGDFGKCSLRLELAGRQFVTRAGATPDRRSINQSAQQIHPVRKFMPERIDPQSPQEDNPHPRKIDLLDIFTILSLFIHRSELPQARAVFTQPQRVLVAFRRRSFV